MMPPILEPVLFLAAIYAALFFLAWLVARDRLSLRVRVLGWLSVAVTVAGFVWSLVVETLLPYLRRGPEGMRYFTLSLLEVGFATAGVGLMFVGAARFLRAWLGQGWRLDSAQAFLEESPRFAALRGEPEDRARWRMAFRLLRDLFLLPGLGWLLLGLGLLIVTFQVFEPDPFFKPDPVLVSGGGTLMLLGLSQMLISFYDQQ